MLIRLPAGLMLCALPVLAQVAEPPRMVTACAIRLRATPEVTGKEAGRLALGEEITVLEKSAPATVGIQTAPWLRVKMADGREGWVFGGFTAELPAGSREALVGQILEGRRARKNGTVAEWGEVAAFCEKQAEAFLGKPLEPDLLLMRMEAVVGLLAALPVGRQSADKLPEHPALRGFDRQLVFSEPAGQWMLRTEAIWRLHDQFKASPLADRIAFVASKAPLPGETEGYLPAVVSVATQTDGQYLDRHPRGAYVGQALEGLIDYLGQFLPKPGRTSPAEFEKGDVAGLQKDLKALGDILRKTQHPRTAEALRIVDELRAFVK